MGACATKPGDLKVKGEKPVVVEDAAAPLAAAEEKAKAGEVVPVPVTAAAEVDLADVSRRRSLSDLLKRDAEASDSDGEADHQEQEVVEKVVAEEPASAAAAGESMGSPQAPVLASVATEQEQDDTAASGDAQAAEEEKRVDPESVQVAAVTAADAAAAPSSEETQESKVADGDATA